LWKWIFWEGVGWYKHQFFSFFRSRPETHPNTPTLL
jgi:hypothetical protein